MNYNDYDRALYYIHCSDWNNLLILMVRTNDHLLSKKIEHFLHARSFPNPYPVVETTFYTLFHYIEHANSVNS
ncbi:YhdB family protein [Bacillus xiapuensis]|uniref:YhdB family protein n=1 Tax=Bacillus xiapuensis TaxID=2014075 RepID=UPI000C244E22|nr:YhdB family protein [Bacillus xiapuensis]